MIRLTRKPKFPKTHAFLEKLQKFDPRGILEEYGRIGVQRLSEHTPVDTGVASQSWSYEVTGDINNYTISWTNSDMAGSVPLVILIQYGHGTRGGTYVPPVDFINPAMEGLVEDLAKALSLEVAS